MLVCLAAGCVPRAQVPLPILEYGMTEASDNRGLLIFLRGIGGSHTDFEKQGLIDAVTSRNLPLDIVVPDAHYGYYENESLVVRLKQDIIEPARVRGYEKFWLAGFSMGGLGSLFYIREHPEDIEAVMLVSPFMGWGTIRKEIQQAGGIKHWDPAGSTVDDWQNLIWSFVQDYMAAPASYPPVYLGYGNKDLVTKNGPQLLSDALSKDRVFTLPGGHSYKTFRALWNEHLDRLEQSISASVNESFVATKVEPHGRAAPPQRSAATPE